MSDFIRPWDVNQQVEEVDNTQSERSFFDNLRDAISAASANFDEVRGSEQLGDLRNELMDSQNLSDDEYNQKRAEYVQKEYERQQARNRFMQAQQNLENDDSFLKNLTQMGGTIEGMAAQLMGTAGGAALGALASPFTAGGSIAMGAKIGNAAGAVAGGYLDARSVALQAEEEVLEKGGTWEQAKLAYEEALKKASLTTLPETAVDIIMGNRLMRSALGSKAARNIAGSALGRVGSSVLDPAAKVGTAVSRMTRPIVGRAAGLATDVALQGVTEAGQEVTQDYIANREVAKALGQQDNEYSLGGFKDYALSDQGLETMKTAGIMGAVFGGAGGALSSGQYLQKGSKYNSSNKIHAVTEKMINEGKLSLNKDERQNEEMIISAFKGISPAQLSTWSDADIIAQSAEIRGEYLRNTSHIDETQDITGVRGFVDVINGVGDNQQQKAKTEGELTALSNSALEEYGITPEDRQKFFSTPTENTLLEKAKKELQKQTEQEKQNGEKQQTKIGLTPETAATMNIKGGTIDVQENSTGEGQTTNLNMSQSARQSTDGVTAEVKYKDNIGEKWQGFTEYTKDGQELEGKAYKNTENGKVARITQGNDGAFYVLDTSEGNTQATRFETLEQAESHLIKNQDNKKVFQSANQQETKEKTTLEKGEVDADNGVTGQHVSNINDLFDFIQNNPDAISPEAFMEFVDMSRRIGTEGVDFYFDTKNYGYAKDDNGVYHKVRGWKQRRDESTGRALIQLYRGSDINTAVHEIAHVGYENLSQEDKKTFDTYAVKTMGRFIADLLNVNYDQNFRNRLLNLANDEELQKKINEQPAAFQAEIQLFLNGEVDINNLTEDQQRAIDERWAWEFTFWYMEGYVRGVKPENIIQRLLNRSCIFLDKELKGIRRVWWHIHHKNSGAESLYRGTEEEPMNGDQQIAQQIQESEQTQQTENVAQQPIEQQQYDYDINPEEEQTQVTDSTGYRTEEPFGTQEEYQNTQEEQQSNNEQNEQEEESQLNLIMNDETAEAFADEGLKRFGNDIEQLKSALRKRYKATKSIEEKKWITKIVKIAELKHFNKWKKQDSKQRLDNVVDVEQNQVGTENIQSTGLQQSNNGYFNANPPQLNPAVVQETTITPQVEEKFDTNDTIEEENEVEENVVGDAIEEVAENVERIYKTELEPQEIKSIEGDINEVLDGLENESDKTVKKISQSVGKRIEAAKSALRKSNKETDKGQEVYKLCSMSALKDVLDSRLKDGYYSKGNLNQDSVNNVGNLIKTQLGEIQEEWTKPYSEETESAARRDKAEANRIEKERKEAEKLAKKKQKKQAEVASQNLDILEQQIKNQQGEELTDDQLEEKADAELVKDNVPTETTNTTKKKKKQTQTKAQEADRRQLIRAAAEKRGMLLDKNGQKPNKKNQQVNDVVEGWIDRLSKEEDYDEAMSQLQELLNSNAITEEEYNDISKGIEEHFEGEEDTGSKAEQAQEILNKAFPNKVFQYAWHSTPHNFDKFTLEHLLSGEGAMVHGWGLYFAKSLKKNKKYYYDRLGNKGQIGDFDLIIEDDTLDYEDYKEFKRELSRLPEGTKRQISNKEDVITIYEGYVASTNAQIEALKELIKNFKENHETSLKLRELEIELDDSYSELEDYEWMLHESKYIKRINYIRENDNKLILVDIPNDDVLLREGRGFHNQPKKVQDALIKLVRAEGLFINDEVSNEELFENFDLYMGVDNNIYDTISWMLEDDDIKSHKKSREMCSKALNLYGIKGISYNGRRDGECAVIFDDTAIDILSKFKKEEGKWKSEKVDNARNRDVDKQKAQRKLEKRNSKRRYMIGAIKRQMLQQKSNVNVLQKLQTIYKDVLKENGIDLNQARNLFKKDSYVFDPRKDWDYKFLKAHVEANELLWEQFKDSGGFFLGLDGKWKFWFSDKNAKLKIPFEQLKERLSKRLNETSTLSLDKLIQHDLLFKYYPELKNMKVIFKDLGSSSIGGEYNPREKNIKLNILSVLEKEDPMTGVEKDELDFKGTLLHEIQHAIQDIENFAQGGGSHDIFNYNEELLPIVSSIKNKLKDDKSPTAKKIFNSSDARISYLLKQIPKFVEGTRYKNKYEKEFWDEVKFLEPLFNEEYEPFLYYINILGEIEAQHSGHYDNLQKDKLDAPPINNDINRNIGNVEIVKGHMSSYSPIIVRKKKNDKRFMGAGKSAKGSPITQEVLDKVEEEYNQKMQEKGISIIQNINMKLRNKAAEDGIENVSDKNDQTFNDKYIQIHDEVNEYFWKKYKLFRGLDGEWRFWISDDGAKLKVSGQDLANGARFPRTFYSVFKLSEVLSHSKLFKNYPQLKNITVLPVWNSGDGTRGSFTEGEGGSGTIRINLAHPSFYSNETVDEEVIRVLLHEVQHAIQDIEGFAQGGEVSADFLKTKPAMNFILRNKGKLILSLADKLQKGVPSYIMKINGEDQKINLSFEENPISGEYNPVVTIGGKKIPSIKNKVLSELLISINNIKEDSVKLKESDFDSIAEYLNPKETEYLSKLFKMFDSGNFSLEFENKKLSKEESIQVAKERLSFLHDKKQLGKILEDYEYGSTLNEDFNVAIENSGLSYELYKSLLGEAEARNTAESYKNKYRKGQVPMTLEESYIKAKNGIGQLRINKKRFMVANEKSDTRRYQETNKKTPLEKAKEQRDARLEQQRKEGITSDFYKDVYSVSFTESAQQNEENKRKMEYFDKRKEYWDRSEKDGKVTYTRKTPFEHHQKVVTYNGINDVTKEQKKKSKPAQWAEWFKDQLIKYAFNDMHFLAKAARKLGVFDAYTKLVVTKGYALKANTAMERGIKYNGEYTRALNDIIKEVGEEKQHDFIEYCIAKRILDMKELRPEIRQKMSPEEAAELIEKYENGENAELFKKNQKDFVKYNHALLHVLVDGGVMTEEEFQHHIKNDPNFVPLAKVMDDADFGFNGIQTARSIVNVKSPIKPIKTSFREVKNPFLEMQKRTAEYYSIAARNKAGQIFVNEIAGKIDKLANGDTVARGQGMIRKIKIDEKDGKLITKPDEKQQIIYVCNNGKHEFYQVSDPEIYRALRALDADQMGTLHKMIDPFLHAPSAFIRETATMVPDFGVRNLLRDGGEAFLTSEHGFLPFIDQIWGMYQMANNTEWYQRFLEQKGEYGTYNRESANDGVARIEDTIDEKVNPIKNFNEIRNAALQKLTNKKNSKATRAVALLQLMGSMPYAIMKSNKRLNDYLEMGTRVGEFKNAKMGYKGTLDRLSKGGILDWDADINKAKQSDVLAAGAAKEITLNFEQYGIVGKQLNRYIPFFNATLQGIYKMCNALELMATGTTLSGQKNRTLQGELLFKAALITAIGVGVAAAGEGDDDYEEANQYEKENFWILPNGLRFPKDQVLGKLFGNVAEKSYTQWRKGKFEPSDILRSIKENFTPDKFIPALAEIALGGMYNYDTFYKSAIVPEYMQGKLGHLQKDLATSNMASDVSDFLWKYTKTDVSAKRLDWALQKNLTNCKKYIDAIYDLGKKAYNPKSFNEKMARGYDKSDSTGAFVGGLKDDVPKPLSLISGTFATNRTNYKSISDFYEKYNDLKKLATDEQSMSKEEKRQWKRYEQAYKKDKVFRKELRAIKGDSSLTGKQKREKADKIFKQQIKLAKWAEG